MSDTQQPTSVGSAILQMFSLLCLGFIAMIVCGALIKNGTISGVENPETVGNVLLGVGGTFLGLNALFCVCIVCCAVLGVSLVTRNAVGGYDF